MRFRVHLAAFVLLAASGFAQKPPEEWQAEIARVRYAPLPEFARVEGDVRLQARGGLVTVLSGPPLLLQTALDSAKRLSSMAAGTDLYFAYHFSVVDTAITVPTVTTVKRGNALERVVLKMLRMKTEKTVTGSRCESRPAPVSEMPISGTTVDIRVYGRTVCAEAQFAALSRNGKTDRRKRLSHVKPGGTFRRGRNRR